MAGALSNLIDTARVSQGLPPAFSPSTKDVNFPKFVFPTDKPWGISPDTNTDEYQALYMIQKDVFRCVSLKSNALAALPKKVFRIMPDGKKVDVTEHPDFALLKNPSPYMNEYDFWEATGGFIELTGECPWAMVLNGLGKPLEINPLRPDKIVVIPDKQDLVSHYEFRNGMNKFRIETDEMIFLKYWNPNSDFRGLSPLRAATSRIEQDLRATKSNLAILKSGSNPSGVLTVEDGEGHDEIDQPTWDRFVADFRQQYEGEAKRGKMMLLRGAMKWQQLGLTNQEMQFMEMLTMAGNSVGEVYGVPPALRMQFQEASKLANVKEQKELFWDPTMRTMARKLAAMITSQLLSRLSNMPSLVFEFDFSTVEALQPDKTAQAERFQKGIRTGAVSPEDYREIVLGLPRTNDPNTNARYIETGLVPIAMAGLPPAEATTERGLVDTFDFIMGEALTHYNPDPVSVKSFKQEASEVMAQRWREMHETKAIASLERIRQSEGEKMRQGIARLFKQQGAEVIANLNTQRAFWGSVSKQDFEVEAVSFNIDEWVQRFEDEGKIHIAAALSAAAADLDIALVDGAVFDLSGDPGAVQWVNHRAREYATLINKTTQKEVDAILRGAVGDGLSIGDTTDLIKNFFTAKAEQHAEVVARTEIVSASNKGRLESMKVNGFEFHMWTTQRDERVRDEHALMGGEVVEIDKAFSNGDAWPQSIGERCATIPQREGSPAATPTEAAS